MNIINADKSDICNTKNLILSIKLSSMFFHTILVSLFTISEVLLLVLKRSKKSAVKSRNDSKSIIFLWIIITCCIITGSIIARRHIWISGDPAVFEVSGIFVFIIGLIIRWIAIFQLGNLFTIDVAISSSHTLKTDGLYKIMRHPSYLGLGLIIIGLTLLMNNLLSGFIVIIPIFFIINYRIRVEEKALTNEFDEQYRQYKLRVKKIIPFIY